MAQHNVKQLILAQLEVAGGKLTIRDKGIAVLRAELLRLAQTEEAFEAGVTVLDTIGLLKTAGETDAAARLTRVLTEVLDGVIVPERTTQMRALAGSKDATRAPTFGAKVPAGAGKRTQVLPKVVLRIR